jgi:hypothetical protein
VGEAAQHDEEHNAGRDPAVEFVVVDDLVSGEGDEQGAEGNDEDTGVTGDSSVHSVEKLCANNGIGRRPTDTGNDVKDGDYEKAGLATIITGHEYHDLLNLTGHHPNQKRDRTIWRKPKAGPKQEKKHTDMTPSRVKNRHTRIASTKPR